MVEKENFLENEEESIDEMDMSNLEIDEDINCDIDITIETDTEFDIMFKDNLNKHKMEGVHSLKRDIIFMGKLSEEVENGFEDSTIFPDFDNNNLTIERGSAVEKETRQYEEYYHNQCLVKDVYKVLGEKTDIEFTENRRKPNKIKFNEYYVMCIVALSHKYSKCEIFVELTYFFTDNIFNMYKLLDKKNATGIILEMQDKGYLMNIGNINFI